ncbi:DUF4373 domain-containing protein [Paenibacillus farraposensis]|uniref:DUF4373 domain-containing protein n=2 Tax=Paenibacillus farraposensis TaxID=2807095 RepID=A0ABW4DGT5_9BACL|nr:DUF4373 domain-containing protein [Paenibacillus farraposensis]MCC3381939.1 DUF4373 domain-containing protein [Paenibacillus farraposensis]
MKEAYYFSHDSNARNDKKILDMLSVYGAEGYGWYWMLVEMMRDDSDYKLDMQSKYSFNAFALQLYADSTKIQSFIMDCINEFGLFESDGAFFWSNSLLRRMEKKKKISESRSNAANKRWNNANASKTDAGAMQNDAKESKGKESKRNKKESKKDIKKNQYAEFVNLSQEEYDKLISFYGEDKTKQMIEILDNYKGANNKKYASDYRAILNWVVKRVEEEERRHGGSSGLPKYQGDSKKGYGGSDRKITRYDQTSNVREFSDEELAGLI